jgi:hypothetical protein
LPVPLHLHKEFTIGPQTVVEVFLDQAAMVYLMDGPNYESYCQELQFSAWGGESTVSPSRIRPGHEDHWHLVIEQKDTSAPLSVRVQLTEEKIKQPQDPKKPLPKGRRKREIPKEVPVERVEVEEGAGKKTFILCLNDVRKVVSLAEFRKIVRAAWKETQIRTHRSVIWDFFEQERQDILTEVGIFSDQSPMLLELSELIRSRYVPRPPEPKKRRRTQK